MLVAASIGPIDYAERSNLVLLGLLRWPDRDGDMRPTFVGRHCPDYHEFFDCLFAAEDKWQELESAFEMITAIANKWIR